MWAKLSQTDIFAMVYKTWLLWFFLILLTYSLHIQTLFACHFKCTILITTYKWLISGISSSDLVSIIIMMRPPATISINMRFPCRYMRDRISRLHRSCKNHSPTSTISTWVEPHRSNSHLHLHNTNKWLFSKQYKYKLSYSYYRRVSSALRTAAGTSKINMF